MIYVFAGRYQNFVDWCSDNLHTRSIQPQGALFVAHEEHLRGRRLTEADRHVVLDTYYDVPSEIRWVVADTWRMLQNIAGLTVPEIGGLSLPSPTNVQVEAGEFIEADKMLYEAPKTGADEEIDSWNNFVEELRSRKIKRIVDK